MNKQLPEHNNIVRVIGIGSHHGVDRLGWLLCDHLKNMHWPDDIDIQNCRNPAQLTELLRDCDSAVIIDAVITGQEAGQIIALGMHELQLCAGKHSSSHGFNVSDALKLTKALGQLPNNIAIFGISVTDATQNADELSQITGPALQQAIREFQQSLAR